MKNKPFFLTSIIFAAVALLLLIISVIVFLTKDISLYHSLEKLLGMGVNSISNSDIAEIASICLIPSFLFAYKSFSDEE